MSLQQAKKIADLREEIENYGTQLAARGNGFRKQVNEELVTNFTQYLETNGFTVSKTPNGAVAKFKALSIKLVLPAETDRYMGIWHSFDILVDDKKYDVVVKPVMTDVPGRPMPSGDLIAHLEAELQSLKAEVTNAKFVGYKFDCAQRDGKKPFQPLLKDTIAEVLDVFLA